MKNLAKYQVKEIEQILHRMNNKNCEVQLQRSDMCGYLGQFRVEKMEMIDDLQNGINISDVKENRLEEYTEPSFIGLLDDEVMNTKETVLNYLKFVPKLKSPLVKRSSSRMSGRPQQLSDSRRTTLYTSYKNKMQEKVKAKMASLIVPGNNVDSDSDIDDPFDELYPTEVYKELGSSVYKCPNCRKNYQKIGFLFKHLNKCTNVIKIEIKVEEAFTDRQCPECGGLFSSEGSVKRHVQNIHGRTYPAEPMVLRSVIERTPGGRNYLSDNEVSNNESDDDESLKCVHCFKCFNKSGHLLKHLKVVHNSHENFVEPINTVLSCQHFCTFCQKNFSTKASLRRHQNLHDLIGETEQHTSPRKSKLSSRLECTKCDKLFSSNPSLKRHVLTEHRGFKSCCPYCRSYVPRLDNHIKLNHMVKKSPCPICEKLLDPAHIARHVNTVHKGVLVRCNLCDVFVVNIHKHMAGVHPVEYKLRKSGHKDHQECDCVFYLGPTARQMKTCYDSLSDQVTITEQH